MIPNPWDGGSARLLAAAGFPALAMRDEKTFGFVRRAIPGAELATHLSPVRSGSRTEPGNLPPRPNAATKGPAN